jgi:hypothetical protein
MRRRATTFNVRQKMKIQLIGFIALAVLTTRLSATSTATTFTQLLEQTNSIIKGKVTGFTPPSNPEDPMSSCILTISVEDTFKGEAKRVVQVRAHTYSSLEIEKLPLLVGKTFIVFMHEPRQKGDPWLYGGPRGLKPISDNYTELVTTVEGSQDESTYFIKEFSQQDYLAILRRNKLTQHERDRP